MNVYSRSGTLTANVAATVAVPAGFNRVLILNRSYISGEDIWWSAVKTATVAGDDCVPSGSFVLPFDNNNGLGVSLSLISGYAVAYTVVAST